MRHGRFFVSGVFVLAALAGHARGQTVTEYPITTANSGPIRITTGPDGNLWFTENNASKIGRITPAGVVTEFTIPTASANPYGIALGADSNLWFTEQALPGKIGRITPAGTFTEFPTPDPTALSQGITPGPDGNLWFVEGNSKIGKSTTAGVITESAFGASGLPSITAGPDGALWYTEQGTSRIGRITTGGSISHFPLLSGGTEPKDITTGPDGNLWFTELSAGAGAIARMTTAGVVTEFLTPTIGSVPYGITVGPDGNLWFTESGASKIGRITTSGAITEFPTKTSGAQPFGIVTGPDGALWFTEFGVNKIGRITTSPASAQFYTVGPCRVADTRNPAGPYGGPSLTANANRTFIIAGQCGVPMTATAVAFNFTITGPTASGDLRTFPAGAGLPLVSTLNWSPGQTRANNAVVALGASGGLTVHPDQASGTVDFIIDVTGYFQ
jgi:virginiamycin B lyase